jgi:hypothetical protein
VFCDYHLANDLTSGPFFPAPTSFDHTDPDYAIYGTPRCHFNRPPILTIVEVNKYAELLMKGNPKVIEPLFTKHLAWWSDEWRAIDAIKQYAWRGDGVRMQMKEDFFFVSFFFVHSHDFLSVCVRDIFIYRD